MRPVLAILIILPALVAVIVYGQTVRLPLLFDDLLHIRLAEQLDLATVWLPSSDFGFYRPLVFLPFLVIKALFGGYPSALLHAVNVVLQGANAFLLAALAWRLWGKPALALAAGLLLALYPFAYQAVAFYGNNVYLFSTAVSLVALHTYLAAIRRRGRTARKWWLITLLLFLIGLFSHEMSVLFGLFAALIQWQEDEQLLRNWRPATPIYRSLLSEHAYLIFLLLGGLYTAVYFFLPTGGGPSPETGTTALLPKALYLLQSLVYPFAWFAHLLPDLPAHLVVFGGFTLTAAWTLWAGRRAAYRRPLLLGWLWWGLASALIGLTLPTYYILHGARLLYLGGVGAAVVWAVLLEAVFEISRVGKVLWAAALAFILISSGLFVQDRLRAFAEIAEPVAVVDEAMADQPVQEGVVLVNVPAWTSPARNTYAAGVEYVTLLGDHLFAQELIEENLGISRPVAAVAVPDLLDDPGYPYGTFGRATPGAIAADWAPAGSDVFVTHYGPEGLRTDFTGRLAPFSGERGLVATFGPYELYEGTAETCGGKIEIVLRWRLPEAEPLPTSSVFVQLLDENGQFLAQADGPPLGLRPDLLQLGPDWQVVDRRQLPADERGARVLVGVYDYTTGERLAGQDGKQQPLPDDALLLPVTHCAGAG